MPISAPDDPGFGIYIHWPFCQSKCPYCDFNSHVARTLDETAFAAALVRELEHYAALTGARTVTSIFFGGGTPSLMSGQTVAQLIDTVARLWPLDDRIEISLEANPTSVEAERFRAYRAAGVNRVSLGVQALNDADLKFLGRLHTSAEAQGAIDIARDTFANMSFDLIYARPHQTALAWERELRQAIALAADHLSLYQLTIEPGTPFEKLYRAGAFAVPRDEAAAELYELTQSLCEAAGLNAYEISNHARAGSECRHNLTYWRYGDYVGAGPGAHGRITVDGRKRATRALSTPAEWADAVLRCGRGCEEENLIAPAEQGAEMLMMGLRLAEGISCARATAGDFARPLSANSS